ncbi:MAG: hypothetical protein K9J16_06800 [Melioribacteraceae bacterium]|nr:hypothetical protein [Melioribacteraceae bacterium]MCF8354501.1 hypothetical protein [Melioribacteraceae bacterium]MCF8394270.1 hypothetical protein [Melioribacteraceae bacterium]MCF8418170.1 hypothetical protein [Melioribacteraceae bacterium]
MVENLFIENLKSKELRFLKEIKTDYEKTGKPFDFTIEGLKEAYKFYKEQFDSLDLPERKRKKVTIRKVYKNQIPLQKKEPSTYNKLRQNIIFLKWFIENWEAEELRESLTKKEHKNDKENTDISDIILENKSRKIWKGTKKEFCMEIVEHEYENNKTEYKGEKDCVFRLFDKYTFEHFPGGTKEQLYESYKKRYK